MPQENEIVSIRINLKEGFIETKGKDGSGIRQEFRTGVAIQLTPFGKDGEGAVRKVLAASQPEPEAVSTDADQAEAFEQVSETAPTRRETSPAVVLPGRLKTTPVEGKPDGHGKPTAWAHFLAHVDGQDGAVLLSATFHNHTREAALQLSAGDALRAQGYLHPSRQPDRLSSFSIFRLIGNGPKPEAGDQTDDESNLLDLHTFLARRRAAERGKSPGPTGWGLISIFAVL